MTTELITFHGDKKLKKMLVEEIKWHQEKDKIIQGTYSQGGKYCAVGCAINSLNRKLKKKYRHSDHSVYEKELGISRIIARLEDRIFEGLPEKEALKFPLKFIKAISVGVNLDHVFPSMMIFILKDCRKYAKKDGKKAIDLVVKGFQKQLKGKPLSRNDWREIEKAAAYADSAADSADSAADSAAAYAADSAARKKAFSRYAKELIRLVKTKNPMTR